MGTNLKILLPKPKSFFLLTKEVLKKKDLLKIL